MKKLFFLSFVLILAACSSQNAFKKSSHGLRYKMIVEDKNATLIKPGEIGTFLMKYYVVANDSLLFNSADLPNAFRIKATENVVEGGSFEEGILMLAPGDSLHFIVSAKSLFENTIKRPLPKYLKETDDIRFEVKLITIVTEEQIAQEQQSKDEELKNKETELINDYIKTNNVTVEPTSSGLYIISEKKGNGAKTVPGKKVKVDYVGTFINGQKFDSSVDRKQPYEFVLGTGQVIPAWDEAIAQLRVGDKVRIIAPSHIAYGPKGYPGAIPPYSTLIFEIEVLGVE